SRPALRNQLPVAQKPDATSQLYYRSGCLPAATISFFFSSRRRHTRCYRDWSSDVCSSDLPEQPGVRCRKPRGDQHDQRHDLDVRSEERRVGKECRLRWCTDHVRKNTYATGQREFRETFCWNENLNADIAYSVGSEAYQCTV